LSGSGRLGVEVLDGTETGINHDVIFREILEILMKSWYYEF